MDPLTHSLIGAGLARAGLAQRFGRGTTLALIAASNLPDIDMLIAIAGTEPMLLYRRTLTHSVFGLPLLAAGAAWLFHRWFPHIPRRALFGLFMLGMVVHVLFDLVNSYGVVALFPLSWRRFELAWIYIIDLALWTMLVAGLAFPRAALAGVALYVGLCAWAHDRAEGALAQATAGPATPSLEYVFPEPLGPHRFRGVILTHGAYQVYLIHVFPRRVELIDVVRTDDAAPTVASARRTARGRRFDWFFKAPVWRVHEADGIEVYDLRFRSLVLPRRTPFVFRF